ncbi:hypothetical protein C1637_12240 [Chryseobacterium lactis]|uniref:C1q domain-containing protein n=1 Tax=Chryseobacterium lactis TaxID=1241981 RepID=A0A3G6RLE5_CHRLC|nr:hypothetical protein [Chryseobacterium lactis]AZA80703.1 hypothetical protein EG342_01700 [Chryseobacterium lactis]AZB05705.1 hypothetical protein EG341_17825 [Chryseobacterium lactis]PNW13575.1 hypothetical protein C1637_12240 [Chryseobacterium lactis]
MRKKLLFMTFLTGLGCAMVNAQSGNIGVNTPNPGSSLTVNGSFAAAYKTVSTGGLVGANDYYIAYNSAGNGTLTLPAAINGAGNFAGRTYHFKNTGTGDLFIAANGSELIDNQNGIGAGVSTLTIPTGYYAFLVSKGTTTGSTWELVLYSNSNTMPSSDNTYPFATQATQIRQSCDATPNPSSPWIRTAIVYQNTILNKGGVVNTATGAFKAPTDGYYVINGSTQFDNGGMPAPPPTFTWTTLYLIKNYAPNNVGTVLVQSYQPTATVVFGSSVSTMTYLAAGDTVTMASVAGVSTGSKYEVVTSSMYGYKIANK